MSPTVALADPALEAREVVESLRLGYETPDWRSCLVSSADKLNAPGVTAEPGVPVDLPLLAASLLTLSRASVPLPLEALTTISSSLRALIELVVPDLPKRSDLDWAF